MTNTPDTTTPSIASIEIENFKRIQKVHIELDDITILVGGNNSGKSSILQAIHTAFSCAQLAIERSSTNKPQTALPEADLLYSPTARFSSLGHSKEWSSKWQGTVKFFPSTREPEKQPYVINLYKASNHNNAGVKHEGPASIENRIADKSTLFSVYVPGLTGIPLREEYKSLGAILRTAGGGEANLVFRNILLQLKENENQIKQLQEFMSKVLNTNVEFEIKFDNARDLYIDVKLALGARKLSQSICGALECSRLHRCLPTHCCFDQHCS